MGDSIFSSSTFSRSKRKANDEDADALDSDISITEDIKKVRISTTPGLLRAQRDVKEVNDSFQTSTCPVELRVCHGEQNVLCIFKELPPSCPRLFRISIPRYYPHSRPTVHCVSQSSSGSSWQSDCISPNSGVCSHPALEEGWMATMTLMDVVTTLELIALGCATTANSLPLSSSCLSAAHGDEDRSDSSHAQVSATMFGSSGRRAWPQSQHFNQNTRSAACTDHDPGEAGSGAMEEADEKDWQP